MVQHTREEATRLAAALPPATGDEQRAAGVRRDAALTSALDDVAFQTNMLALHAALEAARGGEQVAGFPAVAKEMRNVAAHIRRVVAPGRGAAARPDRPAAASSAPGDPRPERAGALASSAQALAHQAGVLSTLVARVRLHRRRP